MKARFRIPFMSWRRIGLFVSGLFTLLTVVVWAIWGLNYSVDFTGGSLWTLRFPQPVSEADVRQILVDHGVDDPVVQHVASDEGYELVIRSGAVGQDAFEQIREDMRSRLGDFEVVSFDDVSPTIGREIRRNAVWALLAATAGMIVYMTIRFEWRFAVTAIVALIHDILVVIGVFAVFRLPVDTTFVAALLTIFGYSINDTIIVYDRIRENMARHRRGQYVELVDESVNQTLTRTINTGMTTLLALAAVALFAGETVRPFAVALLVGIVAGTYSSIFIASALWVEWRLREQRGQAAA